MADERDPQVSSRYRELGAEEPPRALDEAILAASRRPARSWTQRWAVPLSLAAVVVLSVTVTLRIQHEQPALESPAEVRAPAAAQEAARPDAAKGQETIKTEKADKPAVRKEPVPFRPAPQTRPPAAAAPSADVRDEAPARTAAKAAAAAPAPPAAAPASRAAREAESGAAGAVAPQAAPAQAAPQRALSKLAAETPERELERIAQLRRGGRHEEADKALAEFRKRLPDYRIPPEILERVERR